MLQKHRFFVNKSTSAIRDRILVSYNILSDYLCEFIKMINTNYRLVTLCYILFALRENKIRNIGVLYNIILRYRFIYVSLYYDITGLARQSSTHRSARCQRVRNVMVLLM